MTDRCVCGGFFYAILKKKLIKPARLSDLLDQMLSIGKEPGSMPVG